MTLSSSAQRVQEALRERGVEARVRELPASTRTAADAAAAIGCAVGQIAKTLVFRRLADDQPILVVAGGGNRVDERRLAELAGGPVAKADADFVRQRLGYAIGGVPPVGHGQPIVTFVDEDLLVLETVWAAAGTPHAVVPLTPAELVAVTGGRVSRLAEVR
jgi:prolyl-tRNA editing enzyme YbaK/EbsC (Cys-tRNA(Pro) deacylase)